MIKRLLPTIITITTLISAAYTLTQLDQLIHTTLYTYGLQFNPNWTDPYWNLLRITLALLAICAATTTINTILIIRPSPKETRSTRIPPPQKITRNTPITTQTRERPPTTPITPSPQLPQMPKPTPKPTPTSIATPAPPHTNPETPDLYKCTHCGKTFTQPLRMLNFQEEPPRIMNVCPFCNETMPTSPTPKETEQEENRTLFRKNNDHTQKPLTQ